MKLGLVALAAIVALLCGFSVKAMELLMFEEHGCPWCARWNADIGGIYAESDQGRRAPLRRIDIRAQDDAGVELARRAHFTPTFILIDEGREVGRIEGYPGPDFFWGLLDDIIETADRARSQ